MSDITITSQAPESTLPDLIELHLPVRGYTAIARSVATSLAARADLALDQLEEARGALTESCALVSTGAPASGRLRCRFDIDRGRLDVRVSGDWPCHAEQWPPRDSLTWLVLTALADRAEARVENELPVVTWTKLAPKKDEMEEPT